MDTVDSFYGCIYQNTNAVFYPCQLSVFAGGTWWGTEAVSFAPEVTTGIRLKVMPVYPAQMVS